MSRCSWLQYFVLNKHFEQLSHLDTDAINIKMTYSLILSFSHFWVDDFTHTQAESEREQQNDSWRKPMHDSCYHFTTISKYIRPPQNAAFFLFHSNSMCHSLRFIPNTVLTISQIPQPHMLLRKLPCTRNIRSKYADAFRW